MVTMWKVVAVCGMVGVLTGLSIISSKDSVVRAKITDMRRGCYPSEGSSVPFPVTGPIALSPSEVSLANQPPVLNPPEGSGLVSLSNEDEAPVSVLFLGEDGRPVAKVFVRGSQVATLNLPAGAYDAMYDSGVDWRADGFGACGHQGKIKGLVVAEPGKASQVVLFGNTMFVLANRMDLSALSKLTADDKLRREARGVTPNQVTLERPGRERSALRE